MVGCFLYTLKAPYVTELLGCLLIVSSYMKFSKDNIDKIIFYPLGAGVVLLILGKLTGSRELLIAGALGLLPLAGVLVFAAIGFAWITADDLIPEFRGKSVLVGLIVLVIAAMFVIGIIAGNGGDESGSCPSYRGFPTC